MFTRDQHTLIAHVARNLWTRLGDRALPLADAALARMHRADDETGLDMWLAIHAGLVDLAGGTVCKASVTVH